MVVRAILAEAVRRGASDIHITSGEGPRFRVQGEIQPPLEMIVTTADIMGLLEESSGDEAPRCFDARREFDGALEIPEVGRFRVHAFHHLCGIALVARVVPSIIPSMTSLGLPPVVRNICDLRRGLVLICGATGSGKSTTMASIIDRMNRERALHIVTLEEPIEFIHRPLHSCVHQREIGVHTRSCAEALRAVLREDPNVIAIGEMRDAETIHLALTAAETGHLVLATIHSNSASKATDRIIDAFPAGQQPQVRAMIAESLEMVVSQTLCRGVDGRRVAAFEVLVGTPAARTLIREGKTHQLPGLMQSSRAIGMQTFDSQVNELIVARVLDPSVAAPKVGAMNRL